MIANNNKGKRGGPQPPNKKIRTPVIVSMSDDMIRLLDRDAVMMNCSKPEIVRDIIRAWYEDDDQ